MALVSPELTVTGGVQVERETERQSGETTSNFGGIATTPDTPFDRGRTTFGYYAQGVLDLASGLALNLNARVDDNSAFGTFFTYRAGAVYRLSSGTRIRASLGRSFKAPTFCEQFCDAPFVVGDSTLQPERSTSWEAGLEQGLAEGRVSIWATYFDQRFRDMIVYDGSGAPGEPTYFNGAAAKARGIETGLTTSLGRDLKVSASYTYLMAEATDDGGLPIGHLCRRRAPDPEAAALGRAVGCGAGCSIGSRWEARSSMWVPGRTSTSTSFRLNGWSFPATPPWTWLPRWRSSNRRPGRPGLSGVLRAENLFDQAYDQVVGFAGRRRGSVRGSQVPVLTGGRLAAGTGCFDLSIMTRSRSALRLGPGRTPGGALVLRRDVGAAASSGGSGGRAQHGGCHA